MTLPAARTRIGRITWRTPAPAPVQRDYSLAWPTPMLWGMFGGGGSNAGVPVTPLSALQSATVYGCVKCLAEDLAKLPLRLEHRPAGSSGWRVDRDHPLNRLLTSPNTWMTSFQFWAYMVTGLELRGNAIAAVLRGPGGNALSMIPLNWDRVSVLLSPKGYLYYNVSHPMVGIGVTLHQDDVVHLRNPMAVDGGYLGISPIAAAQDVVGLPLAAQQHGAVLFRQGTQMPGYLKEPPGMPSSPERAAQIAQAWMNTYGGVQNAHKVGVLQNGMEFVKIGMTNEEAQFLETRRFGSIEICRLYRVPPHKEQDLENAHFDNLELSERAYVNDALQPLATEIEQRLAAVMLFDDERAEFRFRFDFDELLRGDFKSRMEGMALAINNRIMSPNEGRAREGLAGYAGGDRVFGPMNFGVVGSTDGSVQPSDIPLVPAPPRPPKPGPDTVPLGSETADQAVV